MSLLLKVNGVRVSYGHAEALFGVTFDLHAGEVVTLLGRNGMGRSTVVKCISGLLPVTAGNITLAGQSVANEPPYIIARLGLGLVPEGRQVFPNLTVEENLVATARNTRHVDDPWSLDKVYAFFPRLQERHQNFGSQLSGGEQQMLAIGRALMTNPQLLVLDEATEGLAPIVRTEIWQALAKLKASGLSQIIIDKNIKALIPLADRHYILEKGQVVWSGTSASLLENTSIIKQYLEV